MNLSQRQLRMFVVTASLGNISRASQALHISQPALTRALQAFEKQLDVLLFARSTRALALTAAGERFLPVAQRLLRDLQQATDHLQDDASAAHGQVALAVGTAFGSTVLPGVLTTYTRAHPGVQLRVQDDNSAGITRKVVQGEVDMGIGSPVGDTSALLCHKLLAAPLGFLANTAHHRLHAGMSTQELARLPLLKESLDTSILQVLRLHGSAVVGQMDGGIEVSSLALQLALARAGAGVAVVSALGASHRDARGLKFVALRPAVQREVFLMIRRDRALSPPALALFDALVSGTRLVKLHSGVQFVH